MSGDVAADDRRRRARWWVLAVALALVGTACFGAVLTRSSDPAAVPAPAASETPAERPQRVAETPVLSPSPRVLPPASPPVHLSIPAIGVSERLLTLGLRPDRTVEVPAPRDASYPGWFRLGTTPGQVGSAVILGHVDSLEGPAVFYRLRFLDRGSRVDVRLRNGAVAHFEVRRIATYPNEDFPARAVYASHGYPALNLVTCGGVYDKARGGYQSNVVAYTRLVGSTPARGGGSQS